MKVFFCLLAALAVVSTNAASNCPGGCPDVEQPVCGSDGFTYSNKCELSIASCKSDGNVTQVSEGRCPRLTLPPSKCDFLCTHEYDPVGDEVGDEEGKTYPNRCEMELAQCRKKAGITDMPTNFPLLLE